MYFEIILQFEKVHYYGIDIYTIIFLLIALDK